MTATNERDLGRARQGLAKIAVIIGIEAYQDGIPALDTPVADARALANVLTRYGYQLAGPETNEGRGGVYQNLTGADLIQLLEQDLPQMVDERSRLLFYFAGHGTRVRLEDGSEPGFLVPADGVAGDSTTYVSMERIRAALDALPSHHKLVILDCCHAGIFRWTNTSKQTRGWADNRQTYREQYESYLKRPVYQVITSAGQQEKALDTFGPRENSNGHSPFALTLIQAFDEKHRDPALEVIRKDGIILASELTGYLKNNVKQLAKRDHNHDQTPQLFALSEEDGGEFVFETRAFKLANLASLGTRNLYKGLAPYQEDDSWLFFGRQAEVQQLIQLVIDKTEKATSGQVFVVQGAAKVGKSSLAWAGLVPALKRQNERLPASERWTIVQPTTSGTPPLEAVAQALAPYREEGGKKNGRLLLILDNLGRTITRANQQDYLAQLNKLQTDWGGSLHLLITIRSEQLKKIASFVETSHSHPFIVEPIRKRRALEDIVRKPAARMMLDFEPPALVDSLLAGFNEPVSLPLLSYILHQMYETYLAQKEANSAERLTEHHYERVSTALNQNIQAFYDGLAERERQTMQRIMLRLVAPKRDGNMLRREVPRTEFAYTVQSEAQRAQRIIAGLRERGLLVGVAHVHLAHNQLIDVWDTFNVWQRRQADRLRLQRALGEAANNWQQHERPAGQYLWNRHPKLSALQALPRYELNKLETAFVAQSVKKKAQDRRNRGVLITAVMIILSLITTFALLQRNIAQAQTAEAQKQQAIAVEQQEIAFWQRAIALAQEAFAVEQQEIAEAERGKAETQRQIAEKEKENALAQEAIALEQKRIAEVERENAIAQEAVALEQKRIAEAERENALAQEALAIEQKELAAEQEAIALAKEAFAVEQQRIAETERENALAQEALALEQKRIAEVERENALAQEEIANEQRRIAEVERENAIAQEAIALEQKRIAEVERENALAQEALALEQKRIAETERENALAQEAVANQQRRIAETERENALAQEALALEQKRIAEAERENALAQEEIAIKERNTAQVKTLLALANHQFSPARNPSVETYERALLMAVQGSNYINHGEVDVSPDFVNQQVRLLMNNLPVTNKLEAWYRTILEHYVYAVAFSPDEQTIVTGARDGKIILWNVNSSGYTEEPEMILTGHGSGSIFDIVYSLDGNIMVTASENGSIGFWDTRSYELMTMKFVNSAVNDLEFSPEPDKDVLASASADGVIRFWDTNNGSLLSTIPSQDDEAVEVESVTSIAYSQYGDVLVSSSTGGAINFWDPVTGKLLDRIAGQKETGVNDVVFSPNRDVLASADTNGEIGLWDVTSEPKRLIKTLVGHQGSINALAFSPNGAKLVSASDDRRIGVWDLTSAALYIEPDFITGHEVQVTDVDFSTDGQILASSGSYRTVRLWDMTADEPAAQNTVLTGHNAWVYSTTFSPDGQNLISGSSSGDLILWDLTVNDPTNSPVILRGSSRPILSVAFSSDELTFASGSMTGEVKLWNIEEARRNSDYRGNTLPYTHAHWIYSVAFSPDGQYLAAGALDEKVAIWNLALVGDSAFYRPQLLTEHASGVYSVAYSQDGTRLASGDGSGEIIIWDVRDFKSPKVLFRLHASDSVVRAVAFSPDGNTVAAGYEDKMVRLWDLTHINPVYEPEVLEGHTRFVSALAYSPNGQTLASSADDGTIRLWHLQEPDPALNHTVLRAHNGWVFSVAYSPDGNTLASSSTDETIILWPSVNSLLNLACERTSRNFSWEEWQQFLIGRPYEKTCEQHSVHDSLCEQPVAAWPEEYLDERGAVCGTTGG